MVQYACALCLFFTVAWRTTCFRYSLSEVGVTHELRRENWFHLSSLHAVERVAKMKSLPMVQLSRYNNNILWSVQGFRRGNRCLFVTQVLTQWGGGHLTVVYGGELLYLWIWRNHSAWLAQLIVDAGLPCDNLNACVILSSRKKGIPRLKKLLGGLNNKEIWRYNNSPHTWRRNGCHKWFPL